MRKPDFFIVGAMKCGTTAMDDYLKQHPEVSIAEKELHFFGEDLWVKGISEKEYLSYFSGAKDEKRVGESSVWYLYSEVACLEIKEFSPSASIIIMLRNPVDMLYSLHSQFIFSCREKILDFKAALDAEDRRKDEHCPPRGLAFRSPKPLFYRDIAKFSGQVKRYFDVFGRENVHVIIYDDFKKDTAKVYRETLDFLGVDADFRPDFKLINPNKTVYSRALQRFIQKPRPFIRWLLPHPLRRRLRKRLVGLNTIYKERPPMDPELGRRLQMEFTPEVEGLSSLLGRDLTHWVKQ